MLTPQELKEMQFDKARFGGYDMVEVDEFLTKFSADYTALFKENAVLKNKLKVLAETVEEYRSVDGAMRKALITAQNMATEMLDDAKRQSEELLANASRAAQEKVNSLTSKIAEEEAKLVLVKKATNEFATKMLYNYQAQVSAMQEFLAISETTDAERAALKDRMASTKQAETVTAPKPAPPAEDDFISGIEKEISEKSLDELGEAEKTAIESYAVEYAPAEQDAGETKRYDLSQLQFGRNYDHLKDEKK